ncbi:uncharacterized protein ARB_02310 [Trichophyton benhamiae CBS 112371]|uniref:Uncharacterized protein n=1 Tax=Arthroderma benhamiae (strain ATCC MYA-4681 / CBS 112371) TaxID=663331 RepID=D4B1I1_ARTBC|nr:uncharacterized protein ARB_02310 [Trichophyton benhamiae CBS 112371]EFE30820.1 hypothetical protein ARB_02310 [Trichophyton benhamiae CBS 112371]
MPGPKGKANIGAEEEAVESMVLKVVGIIIGYALLTSRASLAWGTQTREEERERRDGGAAGRESYTARILGDREDEGISSTTASNDDDREKDEKLSVQRSKVEVAFSCFSLFGLPRG